MNLVNTFKENGYIILDIPKLNDSNLRKAFKEFVGKDMAYKQEFLQRNYNNQLDGYSFMGQEDSLNQAKEDLVETFVLSDFTTHKKYPKEFNTFFKKEWRSTIDMVNKISQNLLSYIDKDLKELFKHNFSQRISCNYYPPVQQKIVAKERLSIHNDMSLFTIFPYGVSSGLQVLKNKNWVDLKEDSKILVFCGFFLEELTAGEYKSLIHKVKLPEQNTERCSFAFFSNPKPEASFNYKDKQYTCKGLTAKYLSQFK